MERPQADLSYVVEKIPMGPAFPTGQLHDISSGMRTFRPVIDTEKCVKCCAVSWSVRTVRLTSPASIWRSTTITARAAAFAIAPASWAQLPW